MPLLKNISDEDLAEQICNGDKDLLGKLQEGMMNDLFYYSKKLASRTANIDTGYVSGWINNKLKWSVFVTDEVAETYLWILEYVRKQCCKYLGLSGASLKTFINNGLAKPWVQPQWVEDYYKRFTRHGIVREGSTSYIPTCIKKLSTNHRNVFLFLRRFKNEEEIANKLKLDLYDVINIVDDIKGQLLKSGKLELITGISSADIDSLYYSDKNDKLAEEIYKDFEEYFQTLEDMDKELLTLKYYQGYTVSDIIEFYTESDRRSDLIEFGLASERHVYDYIDDLLGKFTSAIKNDEIGHKKDAITLLLEKFIYRENE